MGQTNTTSYPDSEVHYFYCAEGTNKRGDIRKGSGVCAVPINLTPVEVYERVLQYRIETDKHNGYDVEDYEWILTALNKL